MGLETATYIDDLVTTNPLATDVIPQGDDHLRLIKSVLKASFPNIADFARYIEQARADVADSATPALWAAATDYANLLGTTTITGFASGAEGQYKLVRFDGARQLTHDGTTLDLPSDANITTVAGDHALFRCRGTTSNIMVAYFRASGKALIAPTTDEISALKYGKQTLFIPASAMNPKATGGAILNSLNNILVQDFDESDAVRFLVDFPKSWNESTVTFKARCVVASGGSAAQTAVFSLAGVAISHDDVFTSASPGTAQTSSATWTANNDLLVGAESSAITIGGSPAAGDTVLFELTRSTAGTLGASVQVSLLGIDIFFTVDAGDDT